LAKKGKSITEELYWTSVPTGRLPLDMPTHIFIAEAEIRVADMSVKQHLALYLFKKRLLRVLPRKVANYPKFALFYIRIVVEMHLHMFMAKEYRGISKQLPNIIVYLK
jgi:hypothetical protein